ncbi:hypothetical protein [Maribacter aestuarii]|uniref:hypothetical protein n=1 Tax=Maribacter aestuarii TaxID=1130723 RepID=UPI00248C2E22|nr:hypothetical protein [Maribacter aestuarii]
MDVKHNYSIRKEIKVYLVFFCSIVAASCGQADKVTIEQVDYENERAIGVTFTTKIDVEKIRFFVGEESQTSVIGVIVGSEDKYTFTPAIAFTPGQTYTIRKKDTQVLASFKIPARTNRKVAELLAIYPKGDTVPENLLKMYFEFAQPMQEIGNALDFISVTNETDGTEIKPFLRLESELWNKERTVLTLWLDPGRIKTDLIPNRERGLPLIAGHSYVITIDSVWKSRDGASLDKKYTKTFYVGPRDDKQPKIKEWQLHIDDTDSIQKLSVDFGEPLDAFLAKETIGIYDPTGTVIKGEFNLEKNGSNLVFTPIEKWLSGTYELVIQSRLEDLAGNNLNRLFDTDLNKEVKPEEMSDTRSIPFSVH